MTHRLGGLGFSALKLHTRRWPERLPLRLGIWILAAIAASGIGCSKTPVNPFERQNLQGVKQNPKGLRFELVSANGRNEFHLSEPIDVNFIFTSTEVAKYKVEVSDENSAGRMERFEVFPGDSVEMNNFAWGYLCCGSWRQPLNPDPLPVPFFLGQRVRFLKPGDYKIYAITRRVFTSEPANEEDQYQGAGPPVTSTILRLRILPDDPQWLKAQLSSAVTALNARPDPDSDSFLKACRALDWLDTPEAVEEKLRRTVHAEPCGSPLALEDSVHRDVVIPRLKQLLRDPDFPVDIDLIEALATAKTLQEHPELAPSKARFEILPDRQLRTFTEQVEIRYFPEIKAAFKKKRGKAREKARVTLSILRDEDIPPSNASKTTRH